MEYIKILVLIINTLLALMYHLQIRKEAFRFIGLLSDINNISNGLIIQWGQSTVPTNYAGIVYFPISFTNTNYVIVATAELEDINFNNDFIRGSLFEHKSMGQILLRSTSQTGPESMYIAIGW